jgi:hypothetical protein
MQCSQKQCQRDQETNVIHRRGVDLYRIGEKADISNHYKKEACNQDKSILCECFDKIYLLMILHRILSKKAYSLVFCITQIPK